MKYQKEADEMMKEGGFWPWSSEVETAQFLYSLVKMHCPKTIVELGTFKGFTALHLASAAEEIGSKFVTVANMDHRSEIFKSTAIEWVNKDSVEYINSLPAGSIDFCFLDTSHRLNETIMELNAIHRAMESGGILVGHDSTVFGVWGALVDLKNPFKMKLMLRTPIVPQRFKSGYSGVFIAQK